MNSNASAVNPGKSALNPIIIIGALFFIFGFVTWLNSVLIPYLKIACQLNHFQAYLVTFAFYIAYIVMAPVFTKILKIFGFKNGMSVGLIIVGIGALLFIPAAMTRVYGLFLLGLFVQGTGLGVLQTASNPYITILGPAESAAKRISIMGICNKLAGGLAPIILGTVVLSDADALTARIDMMPEAEKIAELNELASRVIVPYICIVAVLVALAVLIYRSGLPEIDTDKEDDQAAQSNVGKANLWQFPHLIFGFLTMFLYVGVEVIAGDTIISYGAAQNISLEVAKFFPMGTMVCMIIGYIVGIVCIPKYIKQEHAMKVCAILGVVFSIGAILTSSYVSVAFIALLGLANSLVYPAIWPLAIVGLGRFTKAASSVLVMGLAGGAVIPVIYGALADGWNPQQAYWILVPCYLFIWYYAVAGHKLGKK